jgi:hypothetical protein
MPHEDQWQSKLLHLDFSVCAASKHGTHGHQHTLRIAQQREALTRVAAVMLYCRIFSACDWPISKPLAEERRRFPRRVDAPTGHYCDAGKMRTEI